MRALVLEGTDIGGDGYQVADAIAGCLLQLGTRCIVDIGNGALGTRSRPDADLPGQVEVVVVNSTGCLATDIFVQVGQQVAVAVIGVVDGGGRLTTGIRTKGRRPKIAQRGLRVVVGVDDILKLIAVAVIGIAQPIDRLAATQLPGILLHAENIAIGIVC